MGTAVSSLGSLAWRVSWHAYLSFASTHVVGVVPRLHPQQCLHFDTEGFLNPEGHFW